MKDWPKPSDFADILQNPKVAFKDNQLKTCDIRKDARGIPSGPSGQFAVVYQAKLPQGKKLAIRVFTSQRDGIKERYQAISDHLAKQSHLSCTVGFKFIEKGIRSTNGKWYDIVRMDWVEGVILLEWLRDKCSAGAKNEIAAMADRWLAMLKDMRQSEIAHGDLQHANVMVTQKNEIKLVDYDSMCVPDLIGEPTLEAGVRPYQHPERGAKTLLSLDLDNFSGLVIYVGLRALAYDPKLWQQHVEASKYDKILFRTEDFEDPKSSGLMKKLTKSVDQEIAQLSNRLLELYRGKIADVRPVQDYLFSWDQVRAAIRAKLFDDAVELTNRSQQPIPKDLVQPIDNARQRCQALLALESAIKIGDERTIQAAFKPLLLNDYPRAASMLPIAQVANEVLRSEDSLSAAIQKRELRKAQKLWDEHERRFAKRPSIQKWRVTMAPILNANKLCDEIHGMMQQEVPDIAPFERAIQELKKIGGHPETDALTSSIQQKLTQLKSWNEFASRCSLLPNPKLENDRNLVVLWAKVEKVLRGWGPASNAIAYATSARQRIEEFQNLEKKLAEFRKTKSLQIAQEIQHLRDSVPRGYLDVAWGTEVDTFVAGNATADKLRALFSAPKCKESEILEIADEVERNHATGFLTQAENFRIQQARKLVPLIEKIQAISLYQPLASLDEQLQVVWNQGLLARCGEVDSHRQAYVDAIGRKQALKDLETALAKSQDDKIFELTTSRLFANYEFPPRISTQLNTFQVRAEQAIELTECIKRGEIDKFVTKFDARTIRQNALFLKGVASELISLVRSEILKENVLGLKEHGVYKLAALGGKRYRASWVFPPSRFSEQCILAVVKSKSSDDPRSLDRTKVDMLALVDREVHRNSGSSRDFGINSANNWYVGVWAVIDLGDLGQVVSNPIFLGQITSPDSANHGAKRW